MKFYTKNAVGMKKNVDTTDFFNRDYEYVELTREEGVALKHQMIETEANAKREISAADRSAKSEISKIMRETEQQLQEMQDELDEANYNAERALRALASMKRFLADRANKDRDIRPRKQRSGYILVATNVRRAKRRHKSDIYYEEIYTVRLQTPFTLDMSISTAKEAVVTDELYHPRTYNFLDIEANGRTGYYEAIFTADVPLEPKPEWIEIKQKSPKVV